MSEFKFGCPYCGQHIKCDSSQSGSVMQCPTCLQQIAAPQAPATADQKLILTGKKLDDRPKTGLLSGVSPLQPPRRGFPVAALALLVFIMICATLVILFHDRLFHFHSSPPVPRAAGGAPAIPQAKDAMWLLNLAAAKIPEDPAAGRIHGQNFLCDRAYLQSGALTLREGVKGPPNFGLVVNFSGAAPDVLAGQSFNIASNAPIAARVTLRWEETDQVVKDNFDTGYAMRLEFGALGDGTLPGKIYFCAPDDSKSYVAGSFVAEVRPPKVVNAAK